MNVGAIRKDGKFSYVYNDYAVDHISIDVKATYHEGYYRYTELEKIGKRFVFDGVNVWYDDTNKLWYVDFFSSAGTILLRILLQPNWIRQITVNKKEVVFQTEQYVSVPKTSHHLSVEYLK